MKIGGLQKATFIDYPGKIASTIFVSGCNWRCPWCHNPNLVLPERIKEQSFIPEKDIFDFLKERQGLLDGVCISGGEPTIYPELIEFCEKIKKMKYDVKLDTNGSNPDMLEKLINGKLIDFAAMDIKAPKEKYAEIIGFEKVSSSYLLHRIEKSANIIKESGLNYEFRTTIGPGINTKRDLLKIALWLTPAKTYVLQNFRPEKPIDPEFSGCNPYSEEVIRALQKTLSPYFAEVKVR